MIRASTLLCLLMVGCGKKPEQLIVSRTPIQMGECRNVDGKLMAGPNTFCSEAGLNSECHPAEDVPMDDVRDGLWGCVASSSPRIDTGPLIQIALAEEIATQEGWNKSGSLARRLHNPLLLWWAGQAHSEPHCGSVDSRGFCLQWNYAEFFTDGDGWRAGKVDLAGKWSITCESKRIFGLNQDLSACKAQKIAYNWSTGDREAYARRIMAGLKRWNLL